MTKAEEMVCKVFTAVQKKQNIFAHYDVEYVEE